jgi:hypothetical protein
MINDTEMMDSSTRTLLGVRLLAQVLGFDSESLSLPFFDEHGNEASTADPLPIERRCESWQDVHRQREADLCTILQLV